MPEAVHQPRTNAASWVRAGAAALLVAGLALTAWAVRASLQAASQRGEQAWANFAETIRTDVGLRLQISARALDTVVAMSASDPLPSRQSLQRLQARRPLTMQSPGLEAIGLMSAVGEPDLSQWTQAVPPRGAQPFQVQAVKGGAALRFIFREVEPFEEHRSLWGADWSGDADAAATVQQALESGQTMLGEVPNSKALTDPAWRPLFLVAPLSTEGDGTRGRRDLAVLVFTLPELMQGVTEVLMGLGDLTLSGRPGQVLFQPSLQRDAAAGRPARYSSTLLLPFGGRILTVQLQSTPQFEREHSGHALALALAAAGLLVSIMVSGAVLRVSREKERSHGVARKLAAELAQMAQVAQASREGMLGLDREGRVRWANASAESLLGQSTGELVGQLSDALLTDRLADGLDPTVGEGWGAALAAGLPASRDLRIKTAERGDLQVHRQLVPLCDADARVVGFVEYWQDQTALKTTQASLALAVQEVQGLWQAVQAHALVTVTDLDGLITDANDAFCRTSGFDRDELVGRDHRIVSSGVHSPEFWADMWQVIRSGQPWRGDVCNRNKAGGTFWVDSLVAPIRGLDGLPQRFVCIRFVNTAAKTWAAKVELERRMLANVLAASHAGTWEIQVPTQQVQINERWAEMLGRTVEGLSPLTLNTWRELLHPQDLPAVNAAVNAHLTGQTPHYECEFRLRHAQADRWVWVHARGLVVARDEQGRPLVFAGVHTDVTARRQAEESQRNNQLLLARIEQLAGVGGWEVDLRTQSSHWSAEALSLLGLDPNRDWQINDILALMPAGDRARQESAIQTTLATTEGWDLEVALEIADGRRVWVRSVGEAEFDDSGPVRLVGALADVTARRDLELASRRNLELLRSVLDTLPCGVSAVGPDLSIVAYNQQLQKLLDIPPALFQSGAIASFEDLVRFNAHRGEYGELVDVEAEVRARLALARSPQPRRFERVRPTGLILEVQSEPMADGGFVTVYNDITARRHAEAQLLQAEALLRGAIDAVNEAFVLFDPQDRLVFCNDKYRQLYAASADLLVPGTRFEEIIRAGVARGQYADAVGREEEWITQRLAAHQRADTQSVQRLGDGRWVRVVERGMPDGHIVGFRVDITDLVEARREAEGASNAKGMFLANMSHEIRTPMNAILGMLELLQRTELNPRQRDYASKTQGAARSLLGLLNDILDFSKAEAGKMVLDPQPFALERLLRDLAVILSANVGTKPIEVLFDVDPALPTQWVADAPRLQQVLINLAGNAIKFTEQGEVLVRLRCVSRQDGMADVELSVRDSGIGIAREHQAQIFGGFSQAEASTSRRFGGTGLGLAISQRLVQLMGGSLSLQSTLGEGSCFSFVLRVPCQGQLLPDADRLRVLLVDDNALAREVHTHMLQALGWSVECAASGKEGVAMALTAERANRGYDVALIDWVMPDMDGWEVVQQLRSGLRGPALPKFVMLTAHSRDSLQTRTQEEQSMLDGFLLKPITAPMVAELIHGLRRVTPPQPSKAPEPARRRLEGLRVLLAEDNIINQHVASELLTAEGAEVTVASDGRLAVDLLRDGADQFDVVLMDMQMPVMDGLMATRAIRQELELVDLPIVAMTANAAESDRERCLAAGMNDHVGKPFDLNQLVKLLLTYQPARSAAAAAPPMDDPMAAIRRRQAEAEALVDDAMQAQAAADGLALREALGRMMGKTELFHRMVTSYSANARQLVSRVRQHQAANDFEEGVQTFHGFKGLSATLGAVNVAALAAKGEANARAEQWPSDTWLSDFDLAIGRACEALQRHSQALRDASSNA